MFPRHIAHSKRCLGGLGSSAVEYDSNRMLIGFYCLAIRDLLDDDLNANMNAAEKEAILEWIWAQHVQNANGAGFRPSSYMNLPDDSDYILPDSPHLIVTYSALLCLDILRDDFASLNIKDLKRFLSSLQRADGSFTAVTQKPSQEVYEADVRMTYCAFAICAMLGDWTCINVIRAVKFIKRCRTYEGGYGQRPNEEAHGGSTYCALAALYLSPLSEESHLSSDERSQTIRWLMYNQTSEGGFSGRTGKDADACYCFWISAPLKILSAIDIIDADENQRFLKDCEFKYGGLAKAPGELPDPYHTYLGLASMSMCRPGNDSPMHSLPEMDPLLNGTTETVQWLLDRLAFRR